ncbi:hypothetical protein EDEG_03695 [Edhazardia aedis USNM 41457]|uniref:NodB homology domain-containing protein n=1 Tax=Edhazardia aedis (strain USNM 41457) TaxID=1003232 RepID=J8ZQ47_EDHAE|nr:hypothetical protein EDEG_03695 [Edhazardia aedis USNM 41457]|eukprot:EJW01818.1 hypothetical protein EDEG_03695 [Edhazardia aedis USNM 41457]
MNFIFLTLCAILKASLPDKCVDNGVIAITFDDGPTGHTEYVLDQLDELGVKATFHFTTQNIVRGNIASLMRRAVEDGHTVGLRVNPKRDYTEMDEDAIKEDLEGQIKVINKECNEKIRFARAPTPDAQINEDVFNALQDKKIIQTGYTYCFYHDAEDADEAVSQLEKILETSSPQYESFIFLLHEEMEKTFPLLEDIVRLGRKKGYEFVNYDECFAGFKPGDANPMGTARPASSLTDKSSANHVLIVPLCLLCFLFIC